MNQFFMEPYRITKYEQRERELAVLKGLNDELARRAELFRKVPLSEAEKLPDPDYGF